MNEEIEQVLDIVDSIVNISMYSNVPSNNFYGISFPVSMTIDAKDKEKIDGELRSRGILGEKQEIKIRLGKQNKITKTEEYFEKSDVVNQGFELDDFEINIKKDDCYEIKKNIIWEYKFEYNEWVNYKRTKIIDDILNG